METRSVIFFVISSSVMSSQLYFHAFAAVYSLDLLLSRWAGESIVAGTSSPEGCVALTKFNYCFSSTAGSWRTFISGKFPAVIWLGTPKQRCIKQEVGML